MKRVEEATEPSPIPARPAQAQVRKARAAGESGAFRDVNLRPKSAPASGTSLQARGRASLATPAAPDYASRVATRDLAVFTRQLATMFHSGVPLVSALEIYGAMEAGRLGEVVSNLALLVNSGHLLSHAMSAHPGVFNGVYVGLIKSGELTGELSPMLDKLANLLERQDRIHRHVVSALTYPVALAVISVLCGGFFLYSILPSIEGMLAALHVPLPWPTRVLVGIGQLTRNPYFVGSVVVLGVLAYRYWHVPLVWLRAQHPVLASLIDKGPLLIPVIGPVVRQLITARIMFTLATLIEAGLPFDRSLDMLRLVTKNPHVSLELLAVKAGIEKGETLSAAFAHCTTLPTMALEMIRAGEESAALAQMVTSVAKMCEESAENSVTTMTVMIEPFLMLGLGLTTGFLVLAVMLPVVKVLETL